MESLRELPQLTKVEVDLRANELGPVLGGFVKASWDLDTQTTPQARRRSKSSGPPSMRCRCVRNASSYSSFDPRPGQGPARSGVVASVGDFGAWTLSAARPQPRRAGGGLSPERFGPAPKKQRSRCGGARAFKLVALVLQSRFAVGLGSLLVWDL